MVRGMSVPDGLLAGAVRVTVLLALPPLPVAMVIVLGEVEAKLQSLLTWTGSGLEKWRESRRDS